MSSFVAIVESCGLPNDKHKPWTVDSLVKGCSEKNLYNEVLKWCSNLVASIECLTLLITENLGFNSSITAKEKDDIKQARLFVHTFSSPFVFGEKAVRKTPRCEKGSNPMASNVIVWFALICAQIKLCSVQKSTIETAIKSVLELLSQKMGKSAGEKDTPCFELPMRTWTPRQSHSFNRQLCTLLIRILDLSKLCSKKELDWFVNFTPEGACGRSNLFKTVVLGKCKNTEFDQSRAV